MECVTAVGENWQSDLKKMSVVKSRLLRVISVVNWQKFLTILVSWTLKIELDIVLSDNIVYWLNFG